MSPLTNIQELFEHWDGEFESAERLLEEMTPIFMSLQEMTLTESDVTEIESLIQSYKKLVQFLQQEKSRTQREASKLNQSAQKMRDYVKFNQSSGYEFYY